MDDGPSQPYAKDERDVHMFCPDGEDDCQKGRKDGKPAESLHLGCFFMRHITLPGGYVK